MSDVRLMSQSLHFHRVGFSRPLDKICLTKSYSLIPTFMWFGLFFLNVCCVLVKKSKLHIHSFQWFVTLRSWRKLNTSRIDRIQSAFHCYIQDSPQIITINYFPSTIETYYYSEVMRNLMLSPWLADDLLVCRRRQRTRHVPAHTSLLVSTICEELSSEP